MNAFAALGLEPGLVDALASRGIDSPFPVQTATLPDALAGRDVCGKAPTGSGKTLAYGLAVLQRVPRAEKRAPRALVLVPTRELAKQVASVLAPYARERRRWVTAFFGGAGMLRQIDDLRRGVDIAVATPGRLTDLVERGECDLSQVGLVVLDEADRMADMGFTPQVTWILDRCATERQTLLYSATLDGDVDSLIRKYLTEPCFHSIAGPDGEEEGDAVLRRAAHLSIPVKHDNKFQELSFVADASRRSIVFVKNRFATERTADAMTELGVSAVAMHGGMTQNAREKALQRWARGEFRALVATDVAARGVHVDDVSLVVHVDPPQDEKDYIHRSGRTARAGKHGVVVSLLRKEQLRSAGAMYQRLGVEVTATTSDAVRDAVRAVETESAEAAPVAGAPAGEWTESIEISAPDPMLDGRDGERPGPRGRDDRSFGGGRPRGDRFGGDRFGGGDRPRGERRESRPWQDRGGDAGRRPERARDDRPRDQAPGAAWVSRPHRSEEGRVRPTQSSDRWESRDRSGGGRDARPGGWGRDSAARAERPRFDRPRDDRPRDDRPRDDRPRDDRARSGWGGDGRDQGRGPVGPRPERSWGARGAWQRDDRSDSRRGDDRRGGAWRDSRPSAGAPGRRDWEPRREQGPAGDRQGGPRGARPFDDGRRGGPRGAWSSERPGSARPASRPAPDRGRPAPADPAARRERPTQVARFDDRGTPLNRRARRELQFGE